MAQSRLEKIGTIYTRITSLLKGKAIKEEDTPLWVALYEAFPPKYEPRYDRRLPKKPVRSIFYEEDLVRARFHKNQSFIPATNLANENVKSATQNFLSMYKTIKQEKGLSDDSAYEQATKQYVSEIEARTESRKENESSTSDLISRIISK
ncbi:probable 28S ribosomal protein S23, mitochondrial isoform X1 [Solenopsis invicta]|uniref:probable 28S ribosomal protein S23, mitochondrial isoform X1 n=1 Tax=Solenopsis invicta TaxID=13686 RepID=UPI000595E404|nr:probable 28S ribosomal protein S23, mitochondrial isoform X1 [Solenopsis invicta]XP_011170276.1 probable 28S ribosomal protein S23, mitochondrial isoform X1 [Solenopsis invicta]